MQTRMVTLADLVCFWTKCVNRDEIVASHARAVLKMLPIVGNLTSISMMNTTSEIL